MIVAYAYLALCRHKGETFWREKIDAKFFNLQQLRGSVDALLACCTLMPFTQRISSSFLTQKLLDSVPQLYSCINYHTSTHQYAVSQKNVTTFLTIS